MSKVIVLDLSLTRDLTSNPYEVEDKKAWARYYAQFDINEDELGDGPNHLFWQHNILTKQYNKDRANG